MIQLCRIYIALQHLINPSYCSIHKCPHLWASVYNGEYPDLEKVVLGPDEELRELESLSLTIKSMFYEREKVPALNINQQNDKSTQEFMLSGDCELVILVKDVFLLECLIISLWIPVGYGIST